MDFPSKFSILLDLLIKKGILQENEFEEYYKEKTAGLKKLIEQKYQQFYRN